jgi:Dyp-type peroxidase family
MSYVANYVFSSSVRDGRNRRRGTVSCAPGNDFLIRPIEVTTTQVVFDLLLAPEEDRREVFPRGKPIPVDVIATAQGQEKTIEVKLHPVAGDFLLREIDFREEAQKALTSDEPSGYVVPPYDWREHWPEGRAPITHLAGRQVVPWDRDKPLERGAEVRIQFPKVGEMKEETHHLVVYVEVPSAGAPQEKVDPQAFDGLELRTSTEIQGNILAGFNKDHQEFLFLRFTDATQARKWVRELTPEDNRAVGPPGKITMTAEVTRFKDRLRKFRQGTDPAAEYLKAVWLNLSFTHAGVRMLQPGLADELDRGDHFTAFREGSKARNKTVGDLGRSDPGRWIVTEPIHAVLTLAADDADDLEQAVAKQLQHAANCDVEVRHRQRGDALPGALKGHEHFGFRESVSQPGIEGYSRPSGPNHPKDTEDADHPGARIVPRKHFLVEDGPDWMKTGTFQVLRLLGQDVARWSAQLRDHAKDLPDDDFVSLELLAAKLIGRWPSGTPVTVAPRRDDRPNDRTGDNQFSFANDDGERCPKFAHVRTQNPRQGLEVIERRILRRGIPFGPVYDPVREAEGGYTSYDDQTRGLCFNAFMADIQNQFEFLQRKAIALKPDPPDTVTGVGENEASHALRLPVAEGAPEEGKVRPLHLRSCVTTLYSVYAFAPALHGLRALAKEPLPDEGISP